MASRVNDEVTSEIVSVEIVINESQSAVAREEGQSTVKKPRRTLVFSLSGNKSGQMKSKLEIGSNVPKFQLSFLLNRGPYLHLKQLTSVRETSSTGRIFVVTVFFRFCRLQSLVMFYKNSSRTFLCRILKEIDTCIMICGGTGIVLSILLPLIQIAA